jgi:pimeloyl-ACP methyl ester carboxylesterase
LTEIWSHTTGRPDGAHVTLIHGSLDRSAGLLKLSRRLDDRYLVTRYDRRGYGRSHPSGGPFGVDQQVDDLVRLLEAQADARRPRLLVGHSYGGNVALALVARHPGLADGVVTYETPLTWRAWWPGDSAGADALAWQSDPALAAERFMRRLIGDERWDRLPESTRRARRAEGSAMVGELLDLRRGPPWHAHEITVPVLAMHGEFGTEHHRRGAETIAAEVPDGRTVMLAGGRHPGPNTHPDEVAVIIDEFVERTVRPSSRA